MDALKVMAILRAAGSMMVEGYRELEKANPGFNESQLLAAEDWARKNIGSAGAPQTASGAASATTIPVNAAFLAAAQAAAAAGARTDYYTPEQAAALAAAKPQQLGWYDGGTDGSIPYRFYSGVRVDSVVPAGTPGTVNLPKTGHVLSLPSSSGKTQAGTEELFFGYCQRVCQQATNGQFEKYIGSVAALLIGGGIGATADKTTWPEAADRFFNIRAYMSDAEKAAADAGWAAWTLHR